MAKIKLNLSDTSSVTSNRFDLYKKIYQHNIYTSYAGDSPLLVAQFQYYCDVVTPFTDFNVLAQTIYDDPNTKDKFFLATGCRVDNPLPSTYKKQLIIAAKAVKATLTGQDPVYHFKWKLIDLPDTTTAGNTVSEITTSPYGNILIDNVVEIQ